MGRAVAAIAAASRDRYVVVGRAIWGVRRVNSDDLRAVGYAALEGSAAGRQAAAEMVALRRRAKDLAAGATPDQVEAHEAELQAQLRAVLEKRDAAFSHSADAAQMLQRRLDGYVVAAVARCGILRDDVRFDTVDVLPDDVDPATIAKDLRSPEEVKAGKAPVYTEPVTIVREEDKADDDKGILWLHSLSAEDRHALGLVIAQLQGQSALAEVTPFRDAADAGAAVAADEGVPGPAAARAPHADPVRDGARGGGRDARAKGGSGGAGPTQDAVPRRRRR